MSQHIKNEQRVPTDLHPYSLDPLGKGKAIDAAAVGIEAVMVGMSAIFRAEVQIEDKQKLHPHMLDTSQNVLRHAGSSMKQVDQHIAQLEKKLSDAIKLTPAEEKYAARVVDYLGKQNSPTTLAMAEAQRGSFLMAKVILEAPDFLIGTKGIDAGKKAAIRDVLLQSAVPDAFTEYENAVKARAKLQRAIDYTVAETAKRSRAWAGDVTPLNDLKTVKLVKDFNRTAEEVQ